MSFLFTAALASLLLVVGPLVAHLLRRGRAPVQEFPPARLVPAARSVARSMARLEDRVLFLLRAALIATLALLGAVPFVRCSRLSLERQGGASVAFAIVLDDSLSMRATLPNGRTRFERAREGALALLASARPGDAIAIVLAGRPARAALAPTMDLKVAELALRTLEVRDAATELPAAVEIARALVADLAQTDRQLIVLSDFAADAVPDGKPALWAPVPELASAFSNCGIAGAERLATGVSVQVACTGKEAAEGRKLLALPTDPLAGSTSTADLSSVPLVARGGVQTLLLPKVEKEVLGVRLSGSDQLARDDASAVGRDSPRLEVAVLADTASSRVSTGGPTVVEQALDALGAGIAVRPISALPDSAESWARYAVAVLDDPGGLGPEVRAALTAWIERGGVAVALLGPRVSNTALGATLEPFSQGPLRWENSAPAGLISASVSWLGPEAEGFSELSPRGRVRLSAASRSGDRQLGRWSDGEPFLVERELGRGVLAFAGLPSSPDQSDFALRPGYLGLLDYFVRVAREQSGQRRGLPGDSFRFPARSKVEVRGPDDRPIAREEEGPAEHRQQLFRADLAGRYRVRTPEGEEERIVWFDAAEITAQPKLPKVSRPQSSGAAARQEVNASPELTLLIVALLGLEVGLRLLRRFARRSREAPAM